MYGHYDSRDKSYPVLWRTQLRSSSLVNPDYIITLIATELAKLSGFI
jgi:hypothetical protein